MDSDSIHALIDQANEFLEAGKPAETLRCLEQIAQHDLATDDRIEFGALKAWALSELGRGDEALDALEPLLDEFPNSARLHGAYGVVLSNGGDLEEARNELELAVDFDEKDEVALANLALVCERLRDFEEASDLYDRALSLGADIDWALPRKAAVLAELGELREACSTLRRYLSLCPEDQSQWITLGIFYGEDEKHTAALRCFRAAEPIDPNSKALRLHWGVSAVRANELELAERQLRFLERIDADSSRPRVLEALLREARGDLRSAARQHELAVAALDGADPEETVFALETAMDFFSRQKKRTRCRELFDLAYQANACTVELCESYRAALGEYLDRGAWFSIVVEADYRPGLNEVVEFGDAGEGGYSRYLRNFQVVARDRDDAIATVVELARRMDEAGIIVREFVQEEPIVDMWSGPYEVEREALVFVDDDEPVD